MRRRRRPQRQDRERTEVKQKAREVRVIQAALRGVEVDDSAEIMQELSGELDALFTLNAAVLHGELHPVIPFDDRNSQLAKVQVTKRREGGGGG